VFDIFMFKASSVSCFPDCPTNGCHAKGMLQSSTWRVYFSPLPVGIAIRRNLVSV
jgi:hypothetical protein